MCHVSISLEMDLYQDLNYFYPWFYLANIDAIKKLCFLVSVHNFIRWNKSFVFLAMKSWKAKQIYVSLFKDPSDKATRMVVYTPISKKMAKYDVKCKQHELMETSKRKYTEQKETVRFYKSMLYETIAEHQDSGVQTSSDFPLLF